MEDSLCHPCPATQGELALANSSWSHLVVPSRCPGAFSCVHHCPEEFLSSEADLQLFSILPVFFTAQKSMLTALLEYCLFTGEVFPAIIHITGCLKMPKSYLISALKNTYISAVSLSKLNPSCSLQASPLSSEGMNALRRQGGGEKLSSGQWELLH